jgi:ribose transport system permease protein
MCLVFSILRPDNFPTFKNAVTILRQGSVLTMMATGTTMVMILGDFDLSVCNLASFAGMLAVGLSARGGVPLALSVILALSVGAAVGIVNGLIVSVLSLSSFIATLATSSVLVGITFLYSRGTQISTGIPPEFAMFGRGYFLGVPGLVFVMAAWSLGLWVVATHTEFGRRLYAVGGNPEAARLSGIRIGVHRTAAFAVSGLGAALGGISLASMLGLGHPQAADGLLLDVFTAAFLGAVTLREGQFHVVGTVIGVLIMVVMLNGLTMMGAEFYLQNIIKGVILIAAVAASGVRAHRGG